MSNEVTKKMHAICYLAIAIAYTVAVVAYAILAFGAFKKEQHDVQAEPAAATQPKVVPEHMPPAQTE